MSEDFWMYIATWLPLTLVTFLAYTLLKAIHSPGKNELSHWLEESKSKLGMVVKRPKKPVGKV